MTPQGADVTSKGNAAAASAVRLRLEDVNKSFRRESGQVVTAVANISFDVQEGEFLVLLGPSGCGKTTLLRCVAGLERPDDGRIEVNGSAVFDGRRGQDVPPQKRRIGMVFQSYALWPHMTVYQNIAYPLRMRGTTKSEIKTSVQRMLDMMRISDLSGQYPGQISGGQQQRVALARALVCGDNLILFDEPLSNVDAKVREHLRLELLAMQRELRFTALYVTHDQDEAMALATNIAVMANGGVAQFGSPQDIYLRPSSSYVGRFIGSTNQFAGTLSWDDGQPVVTTTFGTIKPAADRVRTRGEHVVIISRPERWSIGTGPTGRDFERQGEVRAAAFVGSHSEYLVDMAGHEVKVWTLDEALLPKGSRVWCGVSRSDLLVLEKD
jgi:iron(III) transport system ATP-binding protein